LIIDPDAPLPCSIAMQALEPVSRWMQQVCDRLCCIQIVKFSLSNRGERLPSRMANPGKKKPLGSPIRETDDQNSLRYHFKIIRDTYYVSRIPSSEPSR
jgi:hypothetical protein